MTLAAPSTPGLELMPQIEYWTTVAVVVVVGILVLLAYRFFWSVQLRRLRDVGVTEVFLVSESLHWGSEVQEWMRSEGLHSVDFPLSVIVGVDARGLAFWKSASSPIVRVPMSHVSSVSAENESMAVALTSRSPGVLQVVRLRPRRLTLWGISAMNPVQVRDLAGRIRMIVEDRAQGGTDA